MRAVLLISAAILLSACPKDKDDNESAGNVATRPPSPPPDPAALIARIEARITMPPGAGPIADYTRRYSWFDPDGGPPGYGTVYGVLERIGSGPRDARWIDGPVMAPDDGGCAVVTLRYSSASGEVTRIACNGEG